MFPPLPVIRLLMVVIAVSILYVASSMVSLILYEDISSAYIDILRFWTSETFWNIIENISRNNMDLCGTKLVLLVLEKEQKIFNIIKDFE